MGTMLVYSITVGVTLAILYLTVKLLLVGSTHFRFNRVVILCCYVAALLSPLMLVEWHHAGIERGVMVEFGIPVAHAIKGAGGEIASRNIVIVALIVAYMVGVAVFTLRAAWVLCRMCMLISRSRKVEVERLNWKLRLHDRSGIGPFSWGGYIVMSEKDYAEGGSLIIKHESMHLQCRHWLDLIMAECVAIVTWYNPAGWLMRQELQSVHEFEADEAVLASGVNAKEYQILLIKKAVGSRFPSIANSLDHSNLSKRIKMMLRKKSSPMQRWLAIATMPAVALSALVLMSPSVANALTKVSTTKVTADKVTNSESKEQVLANEINSAKTVKSLDNATITLDGKTIKKQDLKDVSPESIETITISNGSSNEGKLIAMTTSSEANAKEDNSNNVRKMASKMPEYKGGQKAMFTYLMENVKYPEEAVEKNIQGNVIVKFVVTETGKVENATVIRGVDPLLDAEALRVISSMPDFEPGMENGKAVSVEYVLPVSFKLQGNKTEDKK